MEYEGPISVGDLVTIKKGATKYSWIKGNYIVLKSYKVRVLFINLNYSSFDENGLLKPNPQWQIGFKESCGYIAYVDIKDIPEAN